LTSQNVQQLLGVSAPVISWTLLSVIIGGALLIGAVIIITILLRYHRLSRMLRSYHGGA
jgi:Flp pilus assembly protein TadB